MEVPHHILVAGAGRIGIALAVLLTNRPHNKMIIINHKKKSLPENLLRLMAVSFQEVNTNNTHQLTQLIQKNHINVIVSCLPYFHNLPLAQVAKETHCHYFDLTEDLETAHQIFSLAKSAQTAFVPQCGIAPGFINLIASNLINQCDHVENVQLYCGALPQSANKTLGYALTWSTAGLINEYANDCPIIKNKVLMRVSGLSGYETLEIENQVFEAFYTSGGAGTLIETYQNKVDNLAYKTLRYLGHYEKMKFLMQDLHLKHDRETLKKILEGALAPTKKDVVITHLIVQGIKDQVPITLIDTRRFLPTTLSGIEFTAIQATTSVGAAIVIDTVLSSSKHYHGPIRQEDFNLKEVLNSPLADYLKNSHCHQQII